MSRLRLSARGHDRRLRVALTIADLAGTDVRTPEYGAEAIRRRGLDHAWRACENRMMVPWNFAPQENPCRSRPS